MPCDLFTARAIIPRAFLTGGTSSPTTNTSLAWFFCVAPEIWRTVDLTKADPMPNWGHVLLPTLEIFEDTREAAEQHDRAGKEARALVPNDVAIVLAGAHRLTRNKNGAVSIRRKTA